MNRFLEVVERTLVVIIVADIVVDVHIHDGFEGSDPFFMEASPYQQSTSSKNLLLFGSAG